MNILGVNKQLLFTSILFLFMLLTYSIAFPISDGVIISIQTLDKNHDVYIDRMSAQLLSWPNASQQDNFRIIDNHDGTYSFQSVVSSYYVCADYSLSTPFVVANRTALLGWEKFKIIPQGGDVYALQSYNGTYVCADLSLADRGRPLVANRTEIQIWEKFTFGLPKFNLCALSVGSDPSLPAPNCNEMADAFLSYVSSNITTRTNNNVLKWRWSDNSVTLSMFNNGTMNIMDFLFFAGHGTEGDLILWDRNLHLADPYWDKPNARTTPYPWFSGRAKWLMVHGCLTFYFYPTEAYENSFNGIHAMVGHGSISYTFRPNECKSWCWYWPSKCCAYYWSAQDAYNEFSKRWISSSASTDFTLWEAWVDCQVDLFSSNSKRASGVELVGIGVVGAIDIGGQFYTKYHGLDDKIRTAYQGATPVKHDTPSWHSDGYLEKRQYIYGTPIYEVW